jgi:aspartyl-tRNA synthetase
LRADRQPEFTQLDVEMSYVEMNDVLTLIEGLIAAIFEQLIGKNITLPLRRLSYTEAMQKYGSDKPDLRIRGMEIVDVSDWAGLTEFRVFKDVIAKGGKVCAINMKGGVKKFTRKHLDDLTPFVQQYGAKGAAWIKVEEDKFISPIEKFLPAPRQQELRNRLDAVSHDVIVIVADDKEEVICQSLGHLRANHARFLELCDYSWGNIEAAWVFDFPSFIWDEEEKRWAANHHPFTAPRDEDLAFLEREPGKVRAKAYDLVINGYEVGGGSIRIHNPEVQSRVFAVLGMSPDQARERFGFLLDALKYGAPPHGGIAFGLDRLIMILSYKLQAEEREPLTNIRDVIAFPKNQKARDLMTGAPAPVDPKQLRELGL